MRPTLFALVVLVPGLALATADYPARLHDHLSLAEDPGCETCHSGFIGTKDTATKPLAQALKARGLIAYIGAGELESRIDQLEADNVDSDGDGTGDVTELRFACDPNTTGTCDTSDAGTGGSGGSGGGGSSTKAPPLKYGCGSFTTPGLLAVGVALSMFLSRRRR